MFYHLPSACPVSAGGWSSSSANGAVQGASPAPSAAGLVGFCMEIEGTEGELLHSPVRNSRECPERTEEVCADRFERRVCMKGRITEGKLNCDHTELL